MIFKWKCSAFIVVNFKPFMRERLKANKLEFLSMVHICGLLLHLEVL